VCVLADFNGAKNIKSLSNIHYGHKPYLPQANSAKAISATPTRSQTNSWFGLQPLYTESLARILRPQRGLRRAAVDSSSLLDFAAVSRQTAGPITFIEAVASIFTTVWHSYTDLPALAVNLLILQLKTCERPLYLLLSSKGVTEMVGVNCSPDEA